MYISSRKLCALKKTVQMCTVPVWCAFSSCLQLYFFFIFLHFAAGSFPSWQIIFFLFYKYSYSFLFCFSEKYYSLFFFGWLTKRIHFSLVVREAKKSRRRDHTFHHKVLWKLKEITSLFSPKYINDLWLFMTVWTNVFCYSEITFSQTVTKKNGFKRRFSFYDNNISISSSNC